MAALGPHQRLFIPKMLPKRCHPFLRLKRSDCVICYCVSNVALLFLPLALHGRERRIPKYRGAKWATPPPPSPRQCLHKPKLKTGFIATAG